MYVWCIGSFSRFPALFRRVGFNLDFEFREVYGIGHFSPTMWFFQRHKPLCGKPKLPFSVLSPPGNAFSLWQCWDLAYNHFHFAYGNKHSIKDPSSQDRNLLANSQSWHNYQTLNAGLEESRLQLLISTGGLSWCSKLKREAWLKIGGNNSRKNGLSLHNLNNISITYKPHFHHL